MELEAAGIVAPTKRKTEINAHQALLSLSPSMVWTHGPGVEWDFPSQAIFLEKILPNAAPAGFK